MYHDGESADFYQRAFPNDVAVWLTPVFTQEAIGLVPAVTPQPEKKVDLLLSGHLFGLLPLDKDLSVGGDRISNTDVRGTIGAGSSSTSTRGLPGKCLGLRLKSSV